MSFNESHEFDLARYEEKAYGYDEQLEDAIIEFKGQLQDAFGEANRNIEDETIIFDSLKEVFKEYFDGYEIEIKDKKC